MIRFCSFVVFCFALIACGNGLPVSSFDAGIDGAGGDSIASSSASTSSSSSGFPADECVGSIALLAPFNGDFGYPYFEDGTHACRRFVPATYPTAYTIARISWDTGGPCEVAPMGTYAVAQKNTLTGFVFAPEIVVPIDGVIPIVATVNAGEVLFVCAVLSVSPRSCVSACHDKLDPDSFWGDTGPDGKTLVPSVLESLSVSPTASAAVTFGNDKQRLLIEAL